MAKKSQLKERSTNEVLYPVTVKDAVIGLGNVDNTSDINKPVSTAQAAAIADAKKAGTDALANFDNYKVTNNAVIEEVQTELMNIENKFANFEAQSLKKMNKILLFGEICTLSDSDTINDVYEDDINVQNIIYSTKDACFLYRTTINDFSTYYYKWQGSSDYLDENLNVIKGNLLIDSTNTLYLSTTMAPLSKDILNVKYPAVVSFYSIYARRLTLLDGKYLGDNPTIVYSPKLETFVCLVAPDSTAAYSNWDGKEQYFDETGNIRKDALYLDSYNDLFTVQSLNSHLPVAGDTILLTITSIQNKFQGIVEWESSETETGTLDGSTSRTFILNNLYPSQILINNYSIDDTYTLYIYNPKLVIFSLSTGTESPNVYIYSINNKEVEDGSFDNSKLQCICDLTSIQEGTNPVKVLFMKKHREDNAPAVYCVVTSL